MKRIFPKMLLFVIILSGCAGTDAPEESVTVQTSTAAETVTTRVTTVTTTVTETETTTEQTYITITDDSGEFAYSGELMEIGSDDCGYMQIPADFVRYVETGSESVLQYSDPGGNSIFSLDRYEDIDYETAAQNLGAYLGRNGLHDVSAAAVTIAGMDAIQLHGSYDEDCYAVIWLIADPADPTGSYYLSLEFDPDHRYMMACTSTFMTAASHNDTE